MAFAFFPILRRAILALPVNNAVTRRDLYSRSTQALAAHFDRMEPPLDQDEIEFIMNTLKYTIRIVEFDIREGADLSDPDYRPNGIDDIEPRLRQAREKRDALRRPPTPTVNNATNDTASFDVDKLERR